MTETGTGYTEWRAGHHDRMPVTSQSLLDEAVRTATREPPTAWELVVAGETNAVHFATLASGAQVVVRVSRRPSCRFESERWALAASSNVGVPVPDVLYLERRDDASGDLWICVETRLPGVALAEIRDADARERIAGEAGEITARLHTIALTGFGYLRPDGTCPRPSWGHVMRSDQTEEQLALTVEHAATFDIPSEWVHAASAEMQRHDELFAPVESRLLHGDLSPAHVLTDGTRVTGLIDFEQAYGGDPVFEFVRWNYFYEDEPLEWLLDGYRKVADPGPDLDLRFRLGRLRLDLALADIYGQMGHVTLGPVVRRHFEDDLHWFGFTWPS